MNPFTVSGCNVTGSRAKGMGNQTQTGFIKDATVHCDGWNIFRELFVACRFAQQPDSKSMETLLFLFPQFNYMAQKEEAYFKMLGPEDLQAPKMKEDSSRLVFSFLVQECVILSPSFSECFCLCHFLWCNFVSQVQGRSNSSSHSQDVSEQ